MAFMLQNRLNGHTNWLRGVGIMLLLIVLSVVTNMTSA